MTRIGRKPVEGVPRTEEIRVRCTPELRDAIERAAREDMRTASDWVRMCILRVLEDVCPTCDGRGLTRPEHEREAAR